MKLLFKLFFGLLLLQPFSSQANFSDEPRLVEVSAKHAKLKAKLRVESANNSSDAASASSTNISQSITEQQGSINGADGCNLNVGNVLIDDAVGNSPNEVIVIIEGDIIQSNNCR